MTEDKQLFITGLEWLQNNIGTKDLEMNKSHGMAEMYATNKVRVIARFKQWIHYDKPTIEEVSPLFKDIDKTIETIFLRLFLEIRVN